MKKHLPITERENYISFHETSYKDDLKHAEDNAIKHPRWAVISGYYAMHDITKLFLAKKFAVKITGPEIHESAIVELKERIHDGKTREKLLKLLASAKDMYFNVERLKENTLPEMLRQGRQERRKSQYYREDYTKEKKTTIETSSYFLDNIAKPFIKIMEALLHAD